MRSPAELRRLAEWVLRAALVALLALALWRSLHERTAGAGTRVLSARELPRGLDDATRGAHIGALVADLDALPTPAERDWLAALRHAGVDVHWRGAPPALALAAERVREPEAPVRLLLAAAEGAPLSLADSAGALDTLAPRGGGATLESSDLVGSVRARQGAYAASVSVPPATDRRAVLVLGRASWESRFVLDALSEAGWRVRGRLPVAPAVDVTDPDLLPLDTARYDVVVALDSSAADLAPAIARFVASGGGLVAAGGATSLAALRAALPAVAGARRPGRILLDADSVTRADLPLRPLGPLRPDAVALERQAAGVAAAVRRAGSGRALSVGYDESWRWRMLGGSAGPAAHRGWWSRTVGLVAPEHEAPRGASLHGDDAPVAALVAALGPPGFARGSGSSSAGGDALPIVLLLLIAAALLAETASRRFRGAR